MNISVGNRIIVGIELGPESSGEAPLTTKIIRTDVIDVHAANASAKLKRVHAFLNLREVIQFPVISFVDGMPNLRTTGG